MKATKTKKKTRAKDFIVAWNNIFHADYVWRQKYNVSFNSKEHRETSQISVMLDILEDRVVTNAIKENERLKKAAKGELKEPSETFKKAQGNFSQMMKSRRNNK